MKSLPTVLAGLALASSWTWIIGMYLPRVMLERYGWLGFFIFAVPNVVGCAVFGHVLNSSETAEKWMNKLRHEARWFSAVTIAYHMLFSVFLMQSLLPEDGGMTSNWSLALIPLLFAVTVGLSYLSVERLIPVGASLWLCCMALLLSKAGGPITVQPTELPSEALFLLPTFAAGFLLCPYLDLTFYEVRIRQNATAFTVFGVAFACMLWLTVLIWMRESPRLTTLVLAHLGLQSLFTCAWHLGALRRSYEIDHGSNKNAFALQGILLPLAVAVAMFVVSTGDRQTDQNWYLRLLLLYGGLFPAALLLRLQAGDGSTLGLLFAFAVITMIPGEFSVTGGLEEYALIPGAILLGLVIWAIRDHWDSAGASNGAK